MTGKRWLAVIPAALLFVAGCSPATSSKSPAAKAPVKAPAATTAPVALTKQQAAALYIKDVRPLNTTLATVKEDATDAVPLSEFRADLRTYTTQLQQITVNFGSVQWPPNAQPYITSLVLTDIPADIGCNNALMTAADWNAVGDTDASNPDCQAAQNLGTALQNQIRTALGLPVTAG